MGEAEIVVNDSTELINSDDTDFSIPIGVIENLDINEIVHPPAVIKKQKTEEILVGLKKLLNEKKAWKAYASALAANINSNYCFLRLLASTLDTEECRAIMFKSGKVIESSDGNITENDLLIASGDKEGRFYYDRDDIRICVDTELYIEPDTLVELTNICTNHPIVKPRLLTPRRVLLAIIIILLIPIKNQSTGESITEGSLVSVSISTDEIKKIKPSSRITFHSRLSDKSVKARFKYIEPKIIKKDDKTYYQVVGTLAKPVANNDTGISTLEYGGRVALVWKILQKPISMIQLWLK